MACFLGKHSLDYQAMHLELREKDGRKVVLRGMTSGAARMITLQRMKSVFRYGIGYSSEVDI
jgi:hypothetical protein